MDLQSFPVLHVYGMGSLLRGLEGVMTRNLNQFFFFRKIRLQMSLIIKLYNGLGW